MKKLLFVFLLVIIICSCRESTTLLPKPRTYPRVEYPEKSYTQFSNNACPFSMQIPTYSIYLKDSLKNEREKQFSCWFDLYYNSLNSYIHFSYVDFNSRAGFDELVKDAFEMADKHNVKASYRDEMRLSFPEKNVYGILFEIDGPVASPLQFFVTDSTKHFVRASLYFNDVVNRDSIQPVYEFVKEDIEVMLESFRWAN